VCYVIGCSTGSKHSKGDELLHNRLCCLCESFFFLMGVSGLRFLLILARLGSPGQHIHTQLFVDYRCLRLQYPPFYAATPSQFILACDRHQTMLACIPGNLGCWTGCMCVCVCVWCYIFLVPIDFCSSRWWMRCDVCSLSGSLLDLSCACFLVMFEVR